MGKQNGLNDFNLDKLEQQINANKLISKGLKVGGKFVWKNGKQDGEVEFIAS